TQTSDGRTVRHPGPAGSHQYVIDEAPAPVLPAFVRPHHRVAGPPVVLRGVAPRRRVAAADVTAGETQAQLHRVRAVPQTLEARLAARSGLRVRQRVGVRALFHDGQITTGEPKPRMCPTWT